MDEPWANGVPVTEDQPATFWPDGDPVATLVGMVVTPGSSAWAGIAGLEAQDLERYLVGSELLPPSGIVPDPVAEACDIPGGTLRRNVVLDEVVVAWCPLEDTQGIVARREGLQIEYTLQTYGPAEALTWSTLPIACSQLIALIEGTGINEELWYCQPDSVIDEWASMVWCSDFYPALADHFALAEEEAIREHWQVLVGDFFGGLKWKLERLAEQEVLSPDVSRGTTRLDPGSVSHWDNTVEEVRRLISDVSSALRPLGDWSDTDNGLAEQLRGPRPIRWCCGEFGRPRQVSRPCACPGRRGPPCWTRRATATPNSDAK